MSDISSPPPLVYLSDTPENETASEGSPEPMYKPLYQSLQAAVMHPSSVGAAWIDTVGDLKNNPRALHTAPYNDGSLHWVDQKGKLLCMGFPAVLDLEGKYGRIGPYFSLTSDHGVKKGTINGLGKIKAVFELAPLTVFSGDDIPLEAVDRSAMAMNVLQTLYATVEEKRNEHLDPSKHPASTPFHRTDVDTDRFKFVVNTSPLFRNLPNPGKLAVRAMTLDDLKSGKSSTLLSPTAMQQLQADNSNLVEEVVDGIRNIGHMPDPDSIYSSTLGVADISKSFIDVPNVRDGNGKLITPDEYERKLENGSVVMVNVYLKLWNLRPSKRNDGGYRPKDGEQNGVRIYQLMLNSMQILPVANISQITAQDNSVCATASKEKRKAADNIEPKSRNKRATTGSTSKMTTRRGGRTASAVPVKEDVPMQEV